MHRGREIDPEPNRVGGFPFALAHEEMVGTGRTPPVDARDRIVLVVMAELPESLARARAASAMRAVRHGVSDALRLDEKRRHALVEVSDDQFSLAIGKRGQNVRLAAKLTGWKIDVRSPKENLAFKEAEAVEAGAEVKVVEPAQEEKIETPEEK